MMSTLSDMIFDLVSTDDLEDAIRIEQEGYPPDEAASIDSFRLRQSQAGNLFLGAYTGNYNNNDASETRKRQIVGYVCATLSSEKTLTHRSMSTHVPGTGSVCIHSVCVDAAYRRRGLGLALLKEYIARLEKATAEEGAPYERVLLIVHEDLKVFYEKAGFEWLGKSEVKHGFKEWFEMKRQLRKPGNLCSSTSMMSTLPDVIFDLVSADDLEDVIRIEQEGIPPDEASTVDSLRLRQSQAGNLFLGAYAGKNGASETRKRQIVGYVCATLSSEKTLTYRSMLTHVPGAGSVCIHSVCVDAAYRRRGLGLALLKEYIARLEKACAEEGAPYERALLIVHEDMKVFYEKAGFEWLGKSEVKLGFKQWFEMKRQLRKPSESATLGNDVAMESPHAQASDGPPQQQQLAGIMEALQRGSGNRNKPPPRALAQFDVGGIKDVITPDGQRAGVSVNKYDLTCPRPGCGSVILKEGIATWVKRSSVQMEPPDVPKHALLPVLPDPTDWWLVTPSPMVFENIGFTRPVSITTEPQVKLLTCADCDLGPLGWTAVGGTEFWLACSRVAYQA